MFSRFFRPVNRLVFQNPPDSISSAGAHSQRYFHAILFFPFCVFPFSTFRDPVYSLRVFASSRLCVKIPPAPLRTFLPSLQPQASRLQPSAARRPVVKYAGALMHHAQNHPDALHSILHAPREETPTRRGCEFFKASRGSISGTSPRRRLGSSPGHPKNHSLSA